MVAGTVVVAETRDELGELTALLSRPAAEGKFRFDGTMLARAFRSTLKPSSGSLNVGRRFLLGSGSSSWP